MPGTAQEVRAVTQPGAYDCQTPEVWTRLAQLALNGDVADFVRNMSAALAIGECVRFRRGERVAVIGESGGVAVVLRRGKFYFMGAVGVQN